MAFDDLTRSQRREVIKLVKELGTGKYEAEFEVDHIPSNQLENSRINIEVKLVDGTRGFLIEFYDPNDFYSIAGKNYIESSTTGLDKTSLAFDKAHLTPKAHKQYNLLTQLPTRETLPSDTIKYWLEEFVHVEEARRNDSSDIVERRFNKWKERAGRSFDENLIPEVCRDLSEIRIPKPPRTPTKLQNYMIEYANTFARPRHLLEEILVEIAREGEEAYRWQPANASPPSIQSRPTEHAPNENSSPENKNPAAVVEQARLTESPRKSSPADELYQRVHTLIHNTKPLDRTTARLIVETVDDAIREFGNTNQEKKVELRKWKAEAEAVLPPRTIQELKERAEARLIEKSYPRQEWLRKLLIFVVGVVIIAAALAGVYKQFLWSKPRVSFTGRVTDAVSGNPIHKARISVGENQEVPQVEFTDSEGVFHLTLRESLSSVRIRVEMDGYGALDRDISPSRGGIEEIHLEPVQGKASATPSPTPTVQPTRRATISRQLTNANARAKITEEKAYKHLDYRKP